VPFSRSDMNDIMQDYIQFSMYHAHNSSLLRRFLVPLTILGKLSEMGMQQCDAMLKNQELMVTLRDAAFDVVLLDPMVVCGDLVADMLGVPLVLSLRFSVGSTLERHCGQASMPASFVPASPLPYTDRMTFGERLINMLTYMGTSVLSQLYWRRTLDSLYTEIKGHPLTRAFVTHGGTNGLYEALFHGVPVVGIPLFGDQPDNLARLSRRGAAVVLNFNHMTVDDLEKALHAVINEPSFFTVKMLTSFFAIMLSFRSNMQYLSSLQREQPMAPLSTATFWLEFVMRHGGARHLRMASHDLYWFQYYSLDTGAALLLSMIAGLALCWAGLRYFLRCCRGHARRQKSD
ncbi:hypothetical protein GOODEAATRI_019373, partial [Goodea atripinnis]